MIRRPPRSTQGRSSAASDVYKRQPVEQALGPEEVDVGERAEEEQALDARREADEVEPVSYTHLRAHETPEHLVCRLLLEKKKKKKAKRQNETRKYNKKKHASG